jgi:hypothetical protein
MENQLPQRVIASISEAERRSAVLDSLKTQEAAMVEFDDFYRLLQDWITAARQAIHLCRLACIALSRNDLEELIDHINALDEEKDLWEQYAVAEWYDDWRGFDSGADDFPG